MDIQEPSKIYHTNGRMIYSCQYHVIFCPKYRRKVLTENIATRLKELVCEQQDKYGYTILEQEVMLDHIHMLLDVNPQIGIYPIVTKIKGYTSNVLRNEFPELRTRLPTLWTNSRFVSTVGSVSLDVVKRYIEDQKNT